MSVHKNAPLTPKGREAMARSVVEGGLSQADAAYQWAAGRLPGLEALGRYAEVAGPSGLGSDLLMRLFEVPARSKADYEKMDPGLKGIAEAFQAAAAEDVTSPTFTLVHEYRGPRASLFHIDLYRIDTPRQLETLGIDDLMGGNSVLLIEWGEKFARFERGQRVKQGTDPSTKAIANCKRCCRFAFTISFTP